MQPPEPPESSEAPEPPPAPRQPSAGWPPGSPRILVTDAWLANAGDAAISLGTEALLRSITPSASVVHACYQWEEVGPLLDGLACVPALEHLVGTPWAPPLPAWDGPGANLAGGADLILSQAAGAFFEGYDPIARFAALVSVTDRGVPLVVAGASIGGFGRALQRSYLRKLLSRARLVSVRDPLSVGTALDLGAGEVVFGTDLSVALFPSNGPARASERPSGISLVLTDHHPVAARRAEVLEAARLLLSSVLDATGKEPLTVWSTVQGLPEAAGEDDAGVARCLVADLPAGAADRIHLEQGYVGPERAIQLAADSRAVVTMRLHASLFAAFAGRGFGLVLDGQRTGVWKGGGKEVTSRIAGPFDAAGTAAVVKRALASHQTPLGALDPLRQRLDDTRKSLAKVIAGLGTAGGG